MSSSLLFTYNYIPILIKLLLEKHNQKKEKKNKSIAPKLKLQL